MKVLRTASVAAVLVGMAGLSAPASANGAGHYSGTATIDCFGCGDSFGIASLSFTGVYNGYAVVSGPASATYTVNEPAVGPACVVTGTAVGSVTGTLNLTFAWTRIGAAALVTTAGDINGASAAAFRVTSPSGIPCGASNVTADVQGAIAGA